MSTIIPFEGSKLPAYLKNFNISELNDDLTAHASSGGFPIISIKGKIFTVVRDKEKTVIPNPKDPESPATSIDMVLIKVNKGTSKVFYANGYSESGDSAKPDCFSNLGERPDASVKNPQSKSCATCPNNQWGSRIGETGGKGKACQDSVRIAVSTLDQLNDPYLIRVPPASIRSLGEYGQMLKKRGVAYNMVVTKIGFDVSEATPKLTFKPIGMLDDVSFNKVQEIIPSDTVTNILGASYTAPTATAIPQDEEEPEIEQPKPVAKKAEVKKPEPKKPAAEEIEVDLDLSGLGFDD